MSVLALVSFSFGGTTVLAGAPAARDTSGGAAAVTPPASSEQDAAPTYAPYNFYIGPLIGGGYYGLLLGVDYFAGYRFRRAGSLGLQGDLTPSVLRDIGLTHLAHRYRVATNLRFGRRERGRVGLGLGVALHHDFDGYPPIAMGSFAFDVGYLAGEDRPKAFRTRISVGFFFDMNSPDPGLFDVGGALKLAFGADG